MNLPENFHILFVFPPEITEEPPQAFLNIGFTPQSSDVECDDTIYPVQTAVIDAEMPVEPPLSPEIKIEIHVIVNKGFSGYQVPFLNQLLQPLVKKTRNFFLNYNYLPALPYHAERRDEAGKCDGVFMTPEQAHIIFLLENFDDKIPRSFGKGRYMIAITEHIELLSGGDSPQGIDNTSQ